MRKFDRRAEWVWRRRGLGEISFGTASPRLIEETNRYIYFRRVFDLGVLNSSARAAAHVSADGRYQLFVNGQRVGRGPARCNPAWQYVDPYDLTPYLRPGRNVIAALAHSYGRHTAWYELPSWEQVRAFGCGGFFFQGEVTTADGVIRLDSGEDWRCLDSPAWRRDVPSGSLGFIEIYDARLAPVGWTDADFDDFAWEWAEPLRVPARNNAGDILPFPVLIPTDIPPMTEALRRAEALIRVAEVENAPVDAASAADIAALFQQEALIDLRHCRVEDPDSLNRAEGVVISTTDSHSVSLVFDFGCTQPGRVQFDVEGPAGAILDFTYSERLHEDGRVHMHRGIPGFDIFPAHRLILREGRQTWEAFELSGFRYLQITVRGCQRPLRLHAVRLNFSAYPVQPRGSFTCSDETLSRIWQVGATTLRHCMLDGYVDCPSREQRQWLDAYVDSLINYAAFGDPHLAAKLLRQVAESQQPDGITMMVAPGDFSVMRFTNIPDFCLYWILAIDAYLDYVGDQSIVDALYPSVVKAIGWFERHLNAENLLTDVPHWVFVDWAEIDKQGQVTALNAQFAAALNTAARLARIVDAPRDAARFEKLRTAVSTAVNALLWDEVRGVYVDARRGGVRSRRISQQSNAAAMAYGVAPVERCERIFSTILDERRLVLTRFGAAQPDPVPFDETQHVVLAQPFTMHFLHRALCAAGQHLTMINNIRRRWGPLIADGDRTFRESWQIIELTSLCHAWSGTPTFDLSSDVLGVKPLAPGFVRFQVAPHPGDITWARGVFPSPKGDIAVDWRVSADRFDLTVRVPPGAQAEIILPDLNGLTWTVILMDDRAYAVDSRLLAAPGIHRVSAFWTTPD
ncbi:MAG: glycoside hydrolase family 78 protein [Anaerolineae bacterium]|nr:glycoside hydrolase family 78 protein [Anaerolineae bacterium]